MVESTMPQVSEKMSSSHTSNEFSYKPMPVTAPVAMAVALLSALAFVSAFALMLCLIGMVIGGISLWRIRRAEGEFSGRWLATAAVVLSAAFLVLGAATHVYVFSTEVPDGYERVSFYRDISKKGFVVEDGRTRVPDDVQAFDGKKIFVKGYVYPTRQTRGIEAFVLVKDNQQCCFGGQPAQNDMILVRMQDDKTVDYYPGLVSVAGTFRAQPPKDPGELAPVYQLDGDWFGTAKTTY